MKRLLFTGASGFVGRACLSFLDGQDWEVHAISRHQWSDSGNIQWHRANAKNSCEMRALMDAIRPTHLLHAAWCTDSTSFWHTLENREWLQASTELFAYFAEAGGLRIVGLGSCAEYDWTNGFCREYDTPCRPNSLYGETKLEAARNLEQFKQGVSTAWARLFYMYGPGGSESRMPGSVISSLIRGEPALCSSGEQQRDFLYIDDVARAIVAILNSSITGPVNVCSGAALPIALIAERAAEIMDSRPLLRLGALPTRPQDPPLIVGDNSRLTQETGWQPQVSLDDGLRRTISRWPAEHASMTTVGLAGTASN